MPAKKSFDWKDAGKFVAMLVKLFSVITATLKKAKVGLEIIDWVTGPGKSFFVQKLNEIGAEFLFQTTPILRAEIDTDLAPRLPFAGASIKKHNRQGKVVIEKRLDSLYVDGQKVVLYRSRQQMNGQTINGHKLRTELDGQSVLSASILDFLKANPEYLPEEWKQDDNGNTIYIFFWGTIFRNSVGDLYVRYLFWHGDGWYENYNWLDGGWNSDNPGAVCASN